RRGTGGPLGEWSGGLVPLWYYEPVRVLEGGEVAADIVAGDGCRPVLPGLVLSRHGQGRVAYLSSALESLYAGSNIRELADFIRNVVEEVSPVEAPYSVEGPECLIANMTARDNTRVLHLTNWTGNKLERNWVNEYYLAPVEDVRMLIRIPEGKSVCGVRALAGGDYTRRVLGDTLEIVFPRVGAYQALAVTFE
ncbi:MAG: hypothetical protein JXQ83_01650, partial [Candidatus Glassbacteria bacterium]|nr:hypothetical protein [Candidatus Glassbacteria bacterium]